MQKSASRVGGLDIGFVSSTPIHSIISESKLLFLFGADEINIDNIAADCFVIYQGHHGDKLAYRADVIIPGAAYTEKDATYVNLEGRVQRTRMAVTPPGDAKSDWYALYEISEHIGIDLKMNHITKVRKRMSDISSAFEYLDEIYIMPYGINHNDEKEKKFSKDDIANWPTNFYMTDSISRNSKVMAQCIDVIAKA